LFEWRLPATLNCWRCHPDLLIFNLRMSDTRFERNRLDLNRLAAALHQEPVGHTIDYHDSVPSTMPLARQLAHQPGTRTGTLVVAEEQTAGRGRFDRRWETPPGQALLLSLILLPPLPCALAQLPMRTALAVAYALERACPPLAGLVGLKWPNDVLLGHSMADAGKVAGILIESEWQADRLGPVVIGIGINVNQEAAALPASPPGAPPPTSVRNWLPGSPLQDRTALLVALCRALGEQFFATADDVAWQAWRDRLLTLGHEVQILADGRLLCVGRAETVTPDGALIVVDEAGARHQLRAGEVTVRHLS
jgi:BirA family biotin operon repressor/biotin-[acetyl-CoA-carboxylase] ligase